eukprot:gene9817-7709_t
MSVNLVYEPARPMPTAIASHTGTFADDVDYEAANQDCKDWDFSPAPVQFVIHGPGNDSPASTASSSPFTLLVTLLSLPQLHSNLLHSLVTLPLKLLSSPVPAQQMMMHLPTLSLMKHGQ